MISCVFEISWGHGMLPAFRSWSWVMWPSQGCNFQETLPFRKDLDSCIMTNQAGLGDLNQETGTGQRWSRLIFVAGGWEEVGMQWCWTSIRITSLQQPCQGCESSRPSAQMQAPHSAAGDKLWGQQGFQEWQWPFICRAPVKLKAEAWQGCLRSGWKASVRLTLVNK